MSDSLVALGAPLPLLGKDTAAGFRGIFVNADLKKIKQF